MTRMVPMREVFVFFPSVSEYSDHQLSSIFVLTLLSSIHKENGAELSRLGAGRLGQARNEAEGVEGEAIEHCEEIGNNDRDCFQM